MGTIGFRHFDIWTEFVYNPYLRNGQRVLFRFVDASVVLMEVEDVGGEKIRFSANVGNGFSTYP